MAKAITAAITAEQKHELLKLRSSRTGKNTAERAYYVLLSSEGKSIAEISSQLKRNPHTVRCWIKRYLRAGISGLIDNGPIHRSKIVSKFVKEHEWVELFYLPPYSPEYNPIELFWKWLKRKIYGSNGFNSIEQLIGCIRKFIWHYNENRLIDPIQFQFSAYRQLL
jgi:transposase